MIVPTTRIPASTVCGSDKGGQMLTFRAAGTITLVVAIGLAGCSEESGGARRGDPSASVLPSPPSSASSTTASAEPSTSPMVLPSPTGAGDSAYVTELVFMMPSGELGCYLHRISLTTGGVSCQQSSRTFTPPPEPDEGGCDGTGDWAAIVSLEDAPKFECASDTFLADHPTLAYGKSVQVANIVCTSAQSGVTCRNTANGRGFQLSRSRYSFSPPSAANPPVLVDPWDHVQAAAFALPSRNIGCELRTFSVDGHSLVVCSIKEFTYTPPPRPSDCPAPDDWGHGLTMGNESYFQCGGNDLQLPRYAILDYGETVTLGSVTCTSATTGVSCADRTDGRRLSLSRERYALG